MKKTNAIRILENLKIPFEAKEYEDNTNHYLKKGAANKTAEKLSIPPETVFKTIVMRTDSKEICVFLQNALSEINLKKARQCTGSKEISPVKPEELLSITGYIRGGCSPIGMKKKFRTFFDSSIKNVEKVHISAGIRGLQLEIKTADLIKVCEAQVVDLKL